MNPVHYLIATTGLFGFSLTLLGIFGGLNRSVIVRGAYLLCVTSVLTALLISSAVL